MRWYQNLEGIRANIVACESGISVAPEEFVVRVQARAVGLSSSGVGVRSHVFLISSPSIEFLIDLLAISHCGGIPFVLDGEFTESELRREVERFRPEFILHAGREVERPGKHQSSSLPADSALVLFSSGTGAAPKAVVHSAGGLARKIQATGEAIPIEQRRVIGCFVPVSLSHGLLGILIPGLFLSDAILLGPVPTVQSFGKIGEYVDRFGMTFLSGTPSTWRLILQTSKPPLKRSLCRVQLASAHTDSGLIGRIEEWSSAPVFNAYGITEAASWIADSRVTSSTPIGMVGTGERWGTEIEVRDLSQDGIGEVYLRNPALFSGYLEGGEFVARSSDWLSTKDLGRLTDDGNLILVGRTIRSINRGGRKVLPEEVEAEILLHPFVLDAVVLETAGGAGIPNIGALVVWSDLPCDENQSAERLKQVIEVLRVKLSSYKIPGEWRIVAKIPRRKNGKPDLQEIGRLWKSLQSNQ